MDNVVSIFSGQTPCWFLRTFTNDQFLEHLKSDTQLFTEHLVSCGECLNRHNILVRNQLARKLAEMEVIIKGE